MITLGQGIHGGMVITPDFRRSGSNAVQVTYFTKDGQPLETPGAKAWRFQSGSFGARVHVGLCACRVQGFEASGEVEAQERRLHQEAHGPGEEAPGAALEGRQTDAQALGVDDVGV